MKKAVLILLILVNSDLCIHAQNLINKWSDKIELHNSKDGFFSSFIGENKNYLYAYFNKDVIDKNVESKKVVAFDKKTMKKRFVAELIGYPSNLKESKKFKGLSHYKTIIYEDVIYAFFLSGDRNSNFLLVKSFSPELKVVDAMKVITTQPKVRQRKNKPANIFVLGNKKNAKVFIGIEKEAKPKTNINLEYKVLNGDFSLSKSNEITLPVRYKGVNWLEGLSNLSARYRGPKWLTGRSSSGYSAAGELSSSYEFGDDGDIHIRTKIKLDKEERRELINKVSTENYLNNISYTLLSVLKLNNGKLISTPIKIDDKKLFSLYKMVTKDQVRIYGYYSDLTKDNGSGKEVHGIFYSVLTDDHEIQDVVFSNFNKKLMKELFEGDGDDKDGGRKAGCCLIGKKASSHANDETMNSDYIIEQAIEGNNGSVYLFTTKMDNYSVTTCTTDANGNQSCTTRYYCRKGNVTTFKISKDGGIEWASNYDRTIRYNGWDIYDVNVIEDDRGFYVTYGTYKNKRAKKPWYMFLKSVDYTNPMEYIFIDRNTGEVSKKVLKVNKPDTPSKMAKYISPTEITVINNRFYVNSSNKFLNPLAYPVLCLGGCLLPDLMTSFSKGYGFYGVLEPARK